MPAARAPQPAVRITAPGVTSRNGGLQKQQQQQQPPRQRWDLGRDEVGTGSSSSDPPLVTTAVTLTPAAAMAAPPASASTPPLGDRNGLTKRDNNAVGRHDKPSPGLWKVGTEGGPLRPASTTATITVYDGVGSSEGDGGDAAEEGSGADAPLDPSLAVDPALLYRNLWLFIWLKAIGSYDSGAFSAVIGVSDGIGESWGLSYIQQGTLTSSVFLGNIIGCPLAGQLFGHYSEKHVLNLSLIVHTVFTFLFATFPSYHMALFNRFFIGLSLAFIVVYTLVWVDAFAPKDRQSVWMASHNSGVPLGIMFGYLAAFVTLSTLDVGWEWSFYVKCVLMLPTIAYVAKVDTRSINARGRIKRDDGKGDAAAVSRVGDAACADASSIDAGLPSTVGEDNSVALRKCVDVIRAKVLTTWSVTKPLLANPVYMCSVLAMCSLYFVATGLQNNVTEYLLNEPFKASKQTITAGFGASVVTAPVCGVIAGGILLDKFGGYQGNLLRVACFALVWGTLAAVFSVVCIFVKTTFTFLLVMSVVLFCGGAIIPPGAGLTMATLPTHLRSFGAAFSQLLYNMLGNFSGPLVCSSVAEATGELKYGIMTLLLSSGLGLIPMGVILIIALRQAKNGSGRGGGGGRDGGGGGALHGGADMIVIEAADAHEDDEDGGEEMRERYWAREAGEEDEVVHTVKTKPPPPPHQHSPFTATCGAEQMARESARRRQRGWPGEAASDGVASDGGSRNARRVNPIQDGSEDEEEAEEDVLPVEAGSRTRVRQHPHVAEKGYQPMLLPIMQRQEPQHQQQQSKKVTPVLPAGSCHPAMDTPGMTATDLSGVADDDEEDRHSRGSCSSSLSDAEDNAVARRGRRRGTCRMRAGSSSDEEEEAVEEATESADAERQRERVAVSVSQSFCVDVPSSCSPSSRAIRLQLSALGRADTLDSAQLVASEPRPSPSASSAHRLPTAPASANVRQHYQHRLKERQAKSQSTSFAGPNRAWASVPTLTIQPPSDSRMSRRADTAVAPHTRLAEV